MSRAKYSAIVLRYVHDAVSAEFVNIGLLFVCSEQNVIRFSVLPRTKRVVEFFPGAKARVIRAALRQATASAKPWLNRSVQASGLPDERAEALREMAYAVVPRDDSALQWSEVFHGLSHDASATFDRLFERLVLRYEEGAIQHKRTDDQVWRTFSKVLEKRNVFGRLQEFEVSAELESVKFKHALKNGKWHLMEPVSFDLASAESITDKAKRLLGQMTLLKGSDTDFRLYFLVGQPEGDEGQEAYSKALRILGEIPCEKVIYPESKAEEFAADLVRVAASAH